MIAMGQSLFFENNLPLPVNAMTSFINEPGYPAAENMLSKNLHTFLLETELNTRLELMDKTSLITITDLRGNIMYSNDLFCKVSGFKRHELIGKTHEVIRHPELPDETIAGAMQLVRSGQIWTGIIKSKSKNNDLFWCQTTIAPVLSQDNKPFKLIWMRSNITDLKRKEIELHTAKERADLRLVENVKNAFRIQSAILPSEANLREIFPEAFVINAPQQTVSGDFYWFDKQKAETVFVLGDGTGHGVSASFVSLIAVTALEFIVKQNQETDPGKILAALNSFIFQSLKKHKGSDINESIDMAVCSYNHKTRMLKYASAKSKIYLVRGIEVYNLDRDDLSIGAQSKDNFKINSKSIFLEKGDRVFMMSDGYCDQIGGMNNKRMGSKQVRALLMLTGSQQVQDQKEQLMNFFLNWKGENEQTDDLSLLGFSIT